MEALPIPGEISPGSQGSWSNWWTQAWCKGWRWRPLGKGSVLGDMEKSMWQIQVMPCYSDVRTSIWCPQRSGFFVDGKLKWGKIWGIFRPLTTDLRRKKKDLQVPPAWSLMAAQLTDHSFHSQKRIMILWCWKVQFLQIRFHIFLPSDRDSIWWVFDGFSSWFCRQGRFGWCSVRPLWAGGHCWDWGPPPFRNSENRTTGEYPEDF